MAESRKENYVEEQLNQHRALAPFSLFGGVGTAVGTICCPKWNAMLKAQGLTLNSKIPVNILMFIATAAVAAVVIFVLGVLLSKGASKLGEACTQSKGYTPVPAS